MHQQALFKRRPQRAKEGGKALKAMPPGSAKHKAMLPVSHSEASPARKQAKHDAHF